MNHGIEASLPPTVLFSMLRGKNFLISSSVKYFFRSTECGARMPCQMTSTP
jgi:hypothetical protein